MLTTKELRFVHEYLECGNAARAALRAGFDPKNASAKGHALLNKADIKEEIAAQRALIARDFDIKRDWLVKRYKALADSNIARVGEWIDDNVTFFDSDALLWEDQYAIESLTKEQSKAGIKTKLTLANKQKALDKLGELIGVSNPQDNKFELIVKLGDDEEEDDDITSSDDDA